MTMPVEEALQAARFVVAMYGTKYPGLDEKIAIVSEQVYPKDELLKKIEELKNEVGKKE